MEANRDGREDTITRMIAALPARNARAEAAWIVCLGSVDDKPTYICRPDYNTVTTDVDKAHGWHYKCNAEAELKLVILHVARMFGIYDVSTQRVGRRSSFR